MFRAGKLPRLELIVEKLHLNELDILRILADNFCCSYCGLVPEERGENLPEVLLEHYNQANSDSE